MPMRPRISLAYLVYLVTIVALCFGLFAATTRIRHIEAENAALIEENRSHRDALGLFDIEDPKLIHAIQLPQNPDEPYRFRVYLPEGRRYVVKYKANRIPKEGLPERGTPHELDSGGYLFSTKMERRYKPGTWEPTDSMDARLDITPTDLQDMPSHGIGVGFSEKDNDWINNADVGGPVYGMNNVGRELELHPAESAVVLFRARAQQVVVNRRDEKGEVRSYSTEEIPDLCDGFMFWVEPLEERAADE